MSGEDFDSVLQYDTSPLPLEEEDNRIVVDEMALKSSTPSPNLYRHDDHLYLGSIGVVSESTSLAGTPYQATEMPPPRGAIPLNNISSEEPDSILVRDSKGVSQEGMVHTFSVSVGPELSFGCNEPALSAASCEASQVSSSGDSTTTTTPSACGGMRKVSGVGVGDSSLEGMEPTAVELDSMCDNQTTTVDNSHDDVDGDDEASQDELGAVDLDSFVSKEVVDLLQELRKEAVLKEGSQSGVVAKGIPRIGEIDTFIDDGLQVDFGEELLDVDQSSHQIISSM